MGSSQEFLLSVLFTILFAYALAKIISFFRTSRSKTCSKEDSSHISKEDAQENVSVKESKSLEADFEAPTASVENEHLEKGNEKSRKDIDFDDEDDDDWEGVESSEIEEDFAAAIAYVASLAGQANDQISNDLQLQFYGLYKIATEGPCTAPQPSALNIKARAKWNAWQRLGTMSAEEAMQKYIELLSTILPDWCQSRNKKAKSQDDSSKESTRAGGVGPVFSSFVQQEDESDDQVVLEAIHMHASEGDVKGILNDLEQKVPVDLKDSQGRTSLHWAVDRGHMAVVEVLLSHDADPNAKDMDGQTPLHYAVVCEREDIAKHLISRGADYSCKDNEGLAPRNCFPHSWHWMSELDV